MVDIEQHALRALEQDALSGAPRRVEAAPGGAHERQDLRRDLHQRREQRRAVDLLRAVAAPERIVVRQQPVDLARQARRIGEIDHADGAAADLVLIGRADAALGRADRLGGVRGLAVDIELAMQRQDQRGVVGDQQVVRRNVDALPFQLLDLGHEGPRVDHHAIADDRQLARADHPGGQQAQLVD